MEARRLLVTGGTGLLGAPVLRFARSSFEVYSAARETRTQGTDGVQFVPCDLLAPGAPVRLIRDVRPTHLAHLAWVSSSAELWHGSVNRDWARASRELLTAFAHTGGRRAVLAGSCAEYDWAQPAPFVEYATPERPHTAYGAAKLEFGNWAEAFGRANGIGVVRARVFNVYGPNERPERLVPSVVRALLAHEHVACTDGTQVRDYLHTDDVARALLALAETGPVGVVNVGAGAGVAVKALVEHVAAHCGHPELVLFGARAPAAGEPPTVVAHTGRLRSTGWCPLVPLAEGVRDTVAWWRARSAARAARA
ncbi:MAG: NAD(P)-dependent oxidoreductase [Planctomycetes bacterium]|nr:NAD(P)-dependent oxidoreductase [Planctomycetota bacterium]